MTVCFILSLCARKTNIMKPLLLVALLFLIPFNSTAENSQVELDRVKAFYDSGDIHQAIQLLERVAATGDAAAQSLLGTAYIEGDGLEKNINEGLRLLELSAAQGYSEAHFNLAQMYRMGVSDIPVDYKKAIQWYESAAKLKNPQATFNLAIMYQQGQGTEQNYTRALELYKQTADFGSGHAMHNIGLMYASGTGVTQDYTEAIYWFKKAVEAGAPKAAFDLGYMYMNGHGAEKDMQKAFTYYKQAAEIGVPLAQINLGYMYHDGLGTKQDFKEAFKWTRLAAEANIGQAQYNLGKMLINGEGTLKSDTLGYAWIHIAALNQNTSAIEYIEIVKKMIDDGKLTDEMITEGENIAYGLIQEHKFLIKEPPGLLDKIKSYFN